MKYFYTVFTILIIHSSWHFTASAQNVEFPDPNLAAAVRGALGLGATDPIPQTNLNTLTYLFASNAGITDLTGLEYATGLWDLYLPRNQVSDISRLASLTRLVNLDLDGNQVSDISPLASLTRLETLDLSKNPISNFAPLAGLTALTSLNLLGTGFSNSDFAHISLLVNLMRLELSDNEISALEGLGAFPNLIYLHLNGNQIRDITPLAGFTSLTQLYLSKNQITDLSPLAGLTGLTWLYINSNQVSDLTPLTGLTGLLRLIICYNPFTDISPIASLTGLTILSIDEAFVESVGVIPGRVVYPCAPLPVLDVAKSSIVGDVAEVIIKVPTVKKQEPVSIYRSRVTQNPVIFNEILNAVDDKNDWIELKNIADEEATLTDWELSIVNSEGENANKDVNLLTFRDYTLPAGGILLIVNTDPNETDLIRGQNIIDPESNPDVPPQYIIVPEMKLPDAPYMLILRSATNRKENGELKLLFEVPEAFEDLAGNYFRSFADYGTQVWPLINTWRPL